MKELLQKTNGKKTYFAAALFFLYGISGLLLSLFFSDSPTSSPISTDDALKAIIFALSLLGIGHKLDKQLEKTRDVLIATRTFQNSSPTESNPPLK